MANEDLALRDSLLELIRGGSAHATVAAAVEDFPAELRGTKPPGAPHTGWQLLEHLRFALGDLLKFCTDPEYLEPKFPDDYWPTSAAPPSADAWDQSVAAFKADLGAFEALIKDPVSNLYAEIPWGDGQTLLREVLLAADHTSYHLGQLVFLRRQLSAWKDS